MLIKRIFTSSLKQHTVRLRRGMSTEGRNLRVEILEASLNNVAALGWTQDSIAKGVMDLGLPPLSHRVLGRGPAEVVEYFIEKKRSFAKGKIAELYSKPSEPTGKSNETAENDSNEVKPGEESANATKASDSSERGYNSEEPHTHHVHPNDILRVAMEAHIDFMAPYIHTWPSALALFADPMQLSVAMTTGMQLADDIVSLGDSQASRSDWYTERMLAVMLYSSTELYMLTDNSPNFMETR